MISGDRSSFAFLKTLLVPPVIIGFVRTQQNLALKPSPRIVRLEGEQIVLDARQSIELRCHRAAVSLQKDGRVDVRGKDVTSRAEQLQRIQGSGVKIN